MNLTTLTRSHIEAMDFIAARLLNFKRIDRELLDELVRDKFNMETETIYHELISKKALRQQNDSLIVQNEETLKQYCLLTGADCSVSCCTAA